MRALIQVGYGGTEVLRVADAPVPSPGPGEVLIEMRAAAVNEWDAGLMRGKPLVNRAGGLLRPRQRILGSDMAGVVAEVGPAAARFKPGDEVFGDLSGSGFGALAEFACAPEAALTPKPKGLTWEQAAALPQAGGLAVAGLARGGPLRPGRSLLVNGAGGGVGTFAIQIARAHGLHVTAVDRPGKLAALRALGAERVWDCTTTDFARAGEQFDLILDVVSRRSLGAYRTALRPGGTCAVIGGDTRRLAAVALFGPLTSAIGGKRVALVAYRPNRPDHTALLLRLLADGSVVPLIDRTYPLPQAVEAMDHYAGGQFSGKIVIVR